MGKKGGFFKGFDRYAKNVTLSYKRSGSFETSIGGICSIFAFTILTYWVCVNVWDTFYPPGKFSTSQSTSLVQNNDGTYDEMSIPMERLFSTYTIEVTGGLPDGDVIEEYMIGLWFQKNTDQTLTAYMPIKC